jgi:hypothetical protein
MLVSRRETDALQSMPRQSTGVAMDGWTSLTLLSRCYTREWLTSSTKKERVSFGARTAEGFCSEASIWEAIVNQLSDKKSPNSSYNENDQKR